MSPRRDIDGFLLERFREDYEGCLIRVRPIMMTTMAALLGSLPIALGLAVVGGLVVSQLITLYLTPVVYTYLAEITLRPSSRSGSTPRR